MRRAVPGDESIVRSLRLQALADAPDALDSTHERELARAMSDWRRWLSEGATFLLEEPDGPRGIVVGLPDWDDPAAVFLISMWVDPEHRGTGAADALIAPLLAWAKETGVAQVLLHVGKSNDRARRAYERNGFRPTGREVARERDGLVEIEMVHTLDHGAEGSPREGSTG